MFSYIWNFQKLKCQISRLGYVVPPRVSLIYAFDFDLLHPTFFVRAHSKTWKLLFSLFSFFFLVHTFFWHILFSDGLSNWYSANIYFSISYERAALGLACKVLGGVLMKDWLKILNSVVDALMFAWSALGCHKIPLNSDPNRISRLWII